MSMMLKRIGRTEFVGLLEKSVGIVKSEKYKALVTMRKGGMWSVVKIVEGDNGVFLCIAPEMDPMIGLAGFFGSDIHEHSVNEIIGRLKSCRNEDVWLQWPEESPHTVPGKVFAIGTEKEMTVFIVPVPKDIDDLNERVREMCAKKCKSAELGLQCGECDGMAACKVLEEVTLEIEKERG